MAETLLPTTPGARRAAWFLLCAVLLSACGDDEIGETLDVRPAAAAAQADQAPVDKRIASDDAVETPEEVFEFASYSELDALFHRLDYTPDSWRRGSRVVPRLILRNIPARFRAVTTQEISVTAKKRVFFRALAPLFLLANELIAADRERVETLATELAGNPALSEAGRQRLAELADAYEVALTDSPGDAAAAVAELRRRVDIVPLSLALAQAAEESGWGTSRFADQGNALFGQWTYSGKGIRPEQQRAGKGDYAIAAFDSPLESAIAYMHNLNTHRAYAAFRKLRAEARSEGRQPAGAALVAGLASYSERGEDYIRTLRSIMNGNDLAAADVAYLAPPPAVLLVPVGGGAD